ncbi:MAG TPA: PEP-CTERM sorting domain-containing protein [Aquabacterium sp.]|uniref:PEP-CTERM sorting domain-containing protein n=1 Tax=Aquabacterium sp. TaxID=1872578 RepID=UPI002E315F86|nr:PEP-CTERM sorting domain-containing protein [Aquabacterium sp.]HEX5354720.1 PEP-CTERM sorting domain-containing protein [Aquabacterium sp.]
MNKSIFRAASAIAVAASLVTVSPAAMAATKADVAFSADLITSFTMFNVFFTASGSGTYANNTFSSAASDVAPGATQLVWDPASALTLSIAGNGAMTFDGLVYDAGQSAVIGDVHFVNGATKFDFADVSVFSVGPLTPAFSTLSTGGTVSGDFALSATGLGGVAKTLGITVPIPAQNVGKLTMTSTGIPAVPEPSTAALGLLGMAGIVTTLARRRRQA